MLNYHLFREFLGELANNTHSLTPAGQSNIIAFVFWHHRLLFRRRSARINFIYRYKRRLTVSLRSLAANHVTGDDWCDLVTVDAFMVIIYKTVGPVTLWWTNIAIENGHLQWIFPLKMVIFHCYVSSPEGTQFASSSPCCNSAEGNGIQWEHLHPKGSIRSRKTNTSQVLKWKCHESCQSRISKIEGLGVGNTSNS